MGHELIQDAIKKAVAGQHLRRDEAHRVFHSIMQGECTPAQIGALLVALRMKGESVEEITGAAEAMRAMAIRVPVRAPFLVDTCGTGGDGASTFNISTSAALVAAAGGAQVAKHGNRSVSSKSGSADVLEAAGVRLDLPATTVGQCIETIGIGFLFAPAHHGAMMHAIGVRREIAIRTLFNLLGPLTNPAGAPNQILGVFSEHWLQPMAEVLHALGSRHVLVVHGEDGMDEISICSPTRIVELKDGHFTRYRIQPEDFGFPRARPAALQVVDAQASLRILQGVLHGEDGPCRHVVLLNAGAALYVAGVVDSLTAGIRKAAQAIDGGGAHEKLQALVQWTQTQGTVA